MDHGYRTEVQLGYMFGTEPETAAVSVSVTVSSQGLGVVE